MSRWLCAALLPALMMGCGSSEPVLHAEVLVVGTADGGHLVARTDGTVLGRLPPGLLPLTVSGGDDIAEAYLVSANGEETDISSVQPAKGYATSGVASQPGRPRGAALVPAPKLIAFVGLKTVLVVLSAGQVSGYQHGTRLWSQSLPADENYELLFVDGRVYLFHLGDCQEISPENGRLTQAQVAVLCSSPGPYYPPGESVVVGDLIAFSSGEAWRRTGQGATPGFRTQSWTRPPVLTVDGTELLVPTRDGVEVRRVTSGKRLSAIVGTGANPSIAVSRDGYFLYALAGETLRTFRLSDGVKVAQVPLAGDSIDRVVGG